MFESFNSGSTVQKVALCAIILVQIVCMIWLAVVGGGVPPLA
jgi:hypothetical protein